MSVPELPDEEDQPGWLVFGAGGQVGRALQSALCRHDNVIFLGRGEADFSQPESLTPLLEQMRPAAIINAAAYTAVDQAESEPELAQRINTAAPGVLARYAASAGIPLVHCSTDYVYDGSGNAPRHEDASVGALNVYGASKLAGEQAVIDSACDYLIFRTSWVYDAEGKNFLTTMLRLGKEREQLSVVADQIGAPSYAPHLANAIRDSLEKAMAMVAFPSGIYHMCGAGETSWHGFAEAIFAAAKQRGLPLAVQQVRPILTTAYPTPAQRPLNSRLDMSRLASTFGIAMPDWHEGLVEAFDAYCAANA